MMSQRFDFEEKRDLAWCPGCGDFAIRSSLLTALERLGIDREKLVMVSGIGQAAKMPQYVNSSFFNGLHGRALPVATAIKAVSPDLTVVAAGGDGDMYGEGGNHLIHAARRNPDIALFVHDNMVYGLTKGQASPTSRTGMKTAVQVSGVLSEPINPLALAIAMNVGFVARALSGDIEGTADIMLRAIRHRGLALVDIFQPCVSFNKLNTLQWFKANTYKIEAGYKADDRAVAFARALEESPFPLGVLYESEERAPFEELLPIYGEDKRPLRGRRLDLATLGEMIGEKRHPGFAE
ncbi:MAG TPA: thiamine pyrophosphate-dependent enzyme [Rectinemataceae bacterium]|nr:thiamine pyrophosphate-dependent enzyme [Rectinemataceae bacterium]